MAGFDFVYFDLDDTLLDHRHAERTALGELLRDHPAFSGQSIGRIRDAYHQINTVLWRAYGAGEIDKATLRHRRFARLLDKFGISEDLADEVGDLYMERYARHWSAIDGALGAFDRIATELPVGLITNGFSEIQRRKLQRFPEITGRLSAIVISEDVGYMKPDPRLFEAARDASGVDGRILYVGDSFQSDVVGAVEAGWSVAWFRRDLVDNSTQDSLTPDPRLADLRGRYAPADFLTTEFVDWSSFCDFALT